MPGPLLHAVQEGAKLDDLVGVALLRFGDDIQRLASLRYGVN